MQVSIAFRRTLESLDALEERFAQRQIAPVPHSREREALLAKALRELARGFGITLQEPLQINSRGEFSLAVLRADGRDPHHAGTGTWGTEFVDILNRHEPRTGQLPGVQDAHGGWCWMNHFQVEKMVREVYAALPPLSS